MDDLTPAQQRIAHLCTSLESDETLRAELEQAGFSAEDWAALVATVRTGAAWDVTSLLDALEEAAAAAGLDGVTSPTRDFRLLPVHSPGMRTVSGWRCPHARPCGRVEAGAAPQPERRCELTGDPLAWVSVTSG
ncbi:hypothetical protein ABZS83_19945 [Streptomyces sp. NPDC005426]|uniref:hypothetical protein n=1 Tax=Streptomyces sp. NPDC005426 TaxID=3155344 RepID=UPI0033A73ABA